MNASEILSPASYAQAELNGLLPFLKEVEVIVGRKGWRTKAIKWAMEKAERMKIQAETDAKQRRIVEAGYPQRLRHPVGQQYFGSGGYSAASRDKVNVVVEGNYDNNFVAGKDTVRPKDPSQPASVSVVWMSCMDWDGESGTDTYTFTPGKGWSCVSIRD